MMTEAVRSVCKLAIVLCLVFTVAGCPNGKGASRPAQSADNQPQHDSAPPALPLENYESAPQLAPAGEPKDPLRSSTDPVDCGPARPNPYGLPRQWTRRDGSCQVCEQEPAAIPLCPPGRHAAAVTLRTLNVHRGQRVQLQGTLSLTPTLCTKRGGPCACNNSCGAILRLARSDTENPYVTLTLQSAPMFCSGDEGALCCPFALDAVKHSANVIASGALLELEPTEFDVLHDAGQQFQLEVETICRVK